MKKTRVEPKTYDITNHVYYDHALYEHDHKENSKKDLRTLVRFNLKERKNKVNDKMIENGILYN